MLQKLFKSRSFYSVALSVVLSFVFVAVVTSAATTISTNISTGGTLTVTGVSQMNGSLQATSTLLATGATTLYATTTLSGEAPFLLGQSSTDLTGQAEGTTFYDSTNKVIRLYDGTAWYTVGTTTSTLTSSGTRVQMANLTTDHIAFGTTTIQSESLVTLEATTTTAIPLTLVGATAQTGDLFRIVRCDNCDPTYTEVFAIDAYGSASTSASWDIAYNEDRAYFSVGGRATTTSGTGAIATEGNLTVTGTITATGAITANGAVTLGDAVTDAILITGHATTSGDFGIAIDAILNLGGLGSSTAAGGFNFGATTTVASSTPAEEFSVTGDAFFGSTGTTTVTIESSDTERGGCIEMNGTGAVSATVYKIYVNEAGSLVAQAGSCKTNL